MHEGCSDRIETLACEQYVENGFGQKKAHLELVSVTFEPGVIGMFQKDGAVLQVDEVGQARRAGVQEGWRLHMVMGQRCGSFDDELFLQAKNGNSSYQVTFVKACEGNIKEFGENEGRHVQPQREENQISCETDVTEIAKVAVLQESDIASAEESTIASEGDVESSTERETGGGAQAGWRIIEVRDRNCKGTIQFADAKSSEAPYLDTFAKASSATADVASVCDDCGSLREEDDWTIL